MIKPDVDDHVDVPATMTSIVDLGFLSCTTLVSIAIPATVMSIGAQAFHKCSALLTASYYAGTAVGLNAFDQTKPLVSILDTIMCILV